MTELQNPTELDLDFHLGTHTPKPIEKLPALENVANYLNANFSTNLIVKILGRLTKNPFVHVFHQYWENFTDISYGPTFNLIIKVDCDELLNIDTLHIQLSTYNGKLIDSLSERFQLNDANLVGDILQQSQLLGYFIRGETRVCLGLKKFSKCDDPTLICETIEDKIITRSPTCQYAVIYNLNSGIYKLTSTNQVCHQCKTFVPSSLDFDEQDIKDEITITDDEIEDDDDVLTTNDFLPKDDFRVVSITNGLPEKLVKLSSISIKKVDDENSPQVPVISNVRKTRQQTKEVPAKIVELEKNVNLTVVVNNGGRAKQLPFTDFRKDLDIEKERQTIREPVLSKKRKKGGNATANVFESVNNDDIAKRTRKSSQNPGSAPKATMPTPSSSAPQTREKTSSKHCPVCNKPFTDITEFMSHLTSCNLEASDDDDPINGDDIFADNDDLDFKPTLDENGFPTVAHLPNFKQA